MFASLNSESPVIPLHRCGTGNCAFPTFSSLGVCAECRDETASLVSSCEDGADTCTASYNSVTATNYKEPSGGYSSIVNQSSITNSSGIADIYTLTASTSFPPAYSATYCSLMWCVKTINATVTNSTYRETLLSTSTAAEPQPDGTAIFRYVSPIDNQPGNFSVSPQAQQAFKTLAGDLKGWSKRQSEREFIHSSPIFAGISEFTISPPNTSYTASDRITPNSPIPLIAAALTTSLRSSLSITGQFVERRTIIRVRWYWLLFPSVMWIFSALFLIVTVWKSWRNENRVGSWGTSGLALMLFGVRDETVRRNVASWSGKEMEKRAKKVWVRLNRDERDGWGLVRAEKT